MRSTASVYLLAGIFIITLFDACVPARQVEELKSKYARCDEERSHLSSETRRLETENTELKAEISELKTKIKALERDTLTLSTSLRKMTKQYDKINELNDELLRKQAELTKGSEAENRKLLANLQELQEDLQKKEDELRQLERDLNAKEKNLENLSTELEKREKRVKELEDLIAEKDARVDDLKKKITDALLGFKEKGLTVEQKHGRIYVSMEAKLLFPKGSTNIDKEGVKALTELGKVLEKQEDIQIMVEGHTDSDPYHGNSAIKDNWDLSVLRSTAVIRILLEKSSIDPKQLIAAGRSKYIPVDPGESKEAKAKNRRIEVIVTPDLDRLFEVLEQN